MATVRVEAGCYIVLGTTHEVICIRHPMTGKWWLRVHGWTIAGPFDTKRAGLQYCQEHPEL
jgi:hypothetical protein